MPNTITPEKLNEWKQTIAAAWNDPEQIKTAKTQQTLVAILRALEHGLLRVVTPLGTEATHTRATQWRPPKLGCSCLGEASCASDAAMAFTTDVNRCVRVCRRAICFSRPYSRRCTCVS